MNSEQIGAIVWALDELKRLAQAREPPDSPFWSTLHDAWEVLSHTHVAGTTADLDIDICALCGFDIRNPIHTRTPKQEVG